MENSSLTVRELIEKLSQYPDYMHVEIKNNETGMCCKIETVKKESPQRIAIIAMCE